MRREHVFMREGVGPCEIHDWPPKQLLSDLLVLMRERHGKGGVNACRECLTRARTAAWEQISGALWRVVEPPVAASPSAVLTPSVYYEIRTAFFASREDVFVARIQTQALAELVVNEHNHAIIVAHAVTKGQTPAAPAALAAALARGLHDLALDVDADETLSVMLTSFALYLERVTTWPS